MVKKVEAKHVGGEALTVDKLPFLEAPCLDKTGPLARRLALLSSRRFEIYPILLDDDMRMDSVTVDKF